MSSAGSVVTLADVDESTLERLVAAAVTDAAADDVTPPVTPGEDWSAGRIVWLKDFHRARRDGLAGPEHEITWAIVHQGAVVGSVRLKQSAVPDVLEIGIWLTRQVRGQGVGRLTMISILERAEALGFRGVRADTTAGNAAALSVLQTLGFDRMPNEDGVGVEALLLFDKD